jgi:hypothetical protein
LTNRSLWLDESLLALNVLEKPAVDLLLRPLDLNQAAPPGFLLLVKLAVAACGESEYALRLVPLLFALVSVPLLAWMVARLFPPGPGLVAVALFAVSPPLIYYAGEFKQYSVDVVVSLGMTAAALPFLNGSRSVKHAVILALTGVAGVWLAHPAPFVLAAAAAALLIHGSRRGHSAWTVTLIITALWTASFLGVYAVSLRDLSAHQGLRQAWSGAFAPAISSPSVIPWLGRQFRGLFAYAFSGQYTGVGVLAVLVGCIALVQRPALLVLLTGPVGCALAAALLGRYPFQDRLVLFTLPQLTLLVGAGVEYLNARLRERRLVMVALITLLLFSPAYQAASELRRPFRHEEARPAITYMQQAFHPTDTVYLYPSAQFAFRYYAKRLGFDPPNVIVGRYPGEEWEDIAGDLEQLRGRGRVWVLLSHFPPDKGHFITYYLDTLGVRRDSLAPPGALLLLYDLR